jgi:hypothetical protein
MGVIGGTEPILFGEYFNYWTFSLYFLNGIKILFGLLFYYLMLQGISKLNRYFVEMYNQLNEKSK